MYTQFTARIDQPVDHQQLQHLLPADSFPAVGQSFLPEAVESELTPEFAYQPAVAKRTCSPKLQPAQLHLHTVHHIGRNRPIFRKQTQRPRTLPLLIEHLETL